MTNLTNPTPRQTTRQTWIDQRVIELMAAGWSNRALATKRAATEWRKQSPQHMAAVKRNARMAAARADRLASLPTSDPLSLL